MAIISLGKLDKDFISVVVGCVACFLNRLLNQYDGTLLFKNIILTNINISSSKLLGIIPYIVSLKFNNSVRQKSSLITSSSTSENQKNKCIKGKLLYLLLSAFIFFINQMFYVITIKIKSNTSILNILITSAFYYLIFKIKLYSHHYFSGILIIITGLITDLVLGNFIYDIKNNILLFIIRIIREAFYSLSSVVDKYIMEKKYISVYELLLSNGIIILIILIIFAIFDYYYIGLDNYSEYFSNFNSNELWVIIGVLITQFGLNLFILIANKNNTPMHIFIIFIFGQLALYINFEGIYTLIIFFLLFIIFLSLIFNEIIEINFCGLSYNTRKNIARRAEYEQFENINRKDTLDCCTENQQYEFKVISTEIKEEKEDEEINE